MSLFKVTHNYASVLYDSIWAVALTINRSLSVLHERNLSLANFNQEGTGECPWVSQFSFQGASGWLNFSHSAAAALVEVDQLQNGQPVQIGLYSCSLNQLFLNRFWNKLETIPSDTLECVYNVITPLHYVPLNTNNLLYHLDNNFDGLFIHYRKEPEIKATSFITTSPAKQQFMEVKKKFELSFVCLTSPLWA